MLFFVLFNLFVQRICIRAVDRTGLSRNRCIGVAFDPSCVVPPPPAPVAAPAPVVPAAAPAPAPTPEPEVTTAPAGADEEKPSAQDILAMIRARKDG